MATLRATTLTILLLHSLLPGLLSFRTVKLGGKDCTFKGEKICNGAVTKEIGKSLVKVCTDGKVKLKPRKQVGEGFPLVGRDTGPGKGEDKAIMRENGMIIDNIN